MRDLLNPDNNPLFSNPDNIPKVYWDRLKQDYYETEFLGFKAYVYKKRRQIVITDFPYKPNFQVYLVILHYLYIKDNAVLFLSDSWRLAREMKGGLHFFDRSHPLQVSEILEVSQNDFEKIKLVCKRFAGREIPSGDFCYEFFIFPEIKIRYIFYEGDEDFSSVVTVNFQEMIDKYFPLDVIWAMVNVVTKAICVSLSSKK